jgi:5'-nucleotidase
VILVAIPKYTKGALTLAAKKKDGQPLASKVDALEAPRENSGYLLAPPATVDRNSVATGKGSGVREIKEWQAIMDYLRDLPAKNKGELPTIPVDARAAEVRAIKAA